MRRAAFGLALAAAALAGQAFADERSDRLAAADRLTPQALAPLLEGAPVQARYWPGPEPLLDPMAAPHWSADGRRLWYVVRRAGAWRRVDVDLGTLTRAERESPAPERLATPDTVRSPDGRFRLFTRGDDLYVEGPDGERRLSCDGEPWYSFAGKAARSNPVLPAPEQAPRVRWWGRGRGSWSSAGTTARSATCR